MIEGFENPAASTFFIENKYFLQIEWKNFKYLQPFYCSWCFGVCCVPETYFTSNLL